MRLPCHWVPTFPHVPGNEQAWDDLLQLAQDKDSDVRVYANHSLGRASIFRATEAERDDFRKELENALEFFEKASTEATYNNPAKFCLPFYRSFYALTFKKQEAKAEVQRYLAEAKSASGGSNEKEKVLGNQKKETVPNFIFLFFCFRFLCYCSPCIRSLGT